MSNTEILREFLIETHENLALLDSDLVKLEANPDERATLAQVFRTLHSVKGTAGFMGLVKLQGVAHAAESLLGRVRAGEIRFNPAIATALLRVIDAVRAILTNIEATGDEGGGDYTAVVAEVDRLRETGGAPPAMPITAPAMPVVPEPQPADSSATIVTSLSGALLAATGTGELKAAPVADTAIRVDVSLLDKLMTLVGELVLARNQIMQRSETRDDSLSHVVQRLDALTTELQASVMKTRMQPIGNVLSKFPRIVRDLSVACAKKVRLELEGESTELDKTLIEAIRDPLTHLIRNAVDHGIEPPAVRSARGKPEEGRLRVVAFHEGGKVIVEITDDGGGLDVGRIRDKAVAAGLVTAEAVSRMSPAELQRLIFLPGFSTAEKVTEVSGRGVGMDVVRTNIEQIGGTVDLESIPGQGTTIRTRIPLTLAIIPALIVMAGGERFAIPQVSLVELVLLEAGSLPSAGGAADRKIEWLHGVPVYRLRGALLPLVFLDQQLELASSRNGTGDVNIVVLQADEQTFGLVVDEIRDTEEIVVKPLQQELKGISVFAGATIMGDGRIALVLDVVGLAERANVIAVLQNRELMTNAEPVQHSASENQALLLFEATAGGQMAIPLGLVSRLEEFPRSALEKLGAQQVVQYRGAILPLIDVSQQLAALTGDQAKMQTAHVSSVISEDLIPVAVCNHEGQTVGLIVRRILDVVPEPHVARSAVQRPGTLFTSIVQDQVTEVVDVAALIRGALHDLVQHPN